MNTDDITKSLGMISPPLMPRALINEIHAALVERDELRALLSDIEANATPAPGGYLVSGELMRKVGEVVKQ